MLSFPFKMLNLFIHLFRINNSEDSPSPQGAVHTVITTVASELKFMTRGHETVILMVAFLKNSGSQTVGCDPIKGQMILLWRLRIRYPAYPIFALH